MVSAPTVTTRSIVWPLVLFTGFAWGGGGLASKWLINGGVDAFLVTAGPFLVAAAVAWAVAVVSQDVRRDAVVAGLVLGALNSALPALFFNLAYETLPAGLVTLILSIGPVITAVVAHRVFADERFNRQKGAGLLLAVAGVGALVFAPGVITGASYGGAAWCLAGALVAGTTAVVVRTLAVRHGARALIAPQLTAAGLTPLLVGAVVGRSVLPAGGLTALEVGTLVAIGVVASYGGFRAMMLANQVGTTGEVSMVGYLIPLVGVTGGIVFFDERVTAGLVVGALLILTGVTIGGRGSRPRRLARSAG